MVYVCNTLSHLDERLCQYFICKEQKANSAGNNDGTVIIYVCNTLS